MEIILFSVSWLKITGSYQNKPEKKIITSGRKYRKQQKEGQPGGGNTDSCHVILYHVFCLLV